jgi:soluble cytochrome b562
MKNEMGAFRSQPNFANRPRLSAHSTQSRPPLPYDIRKDNFFVKAPISKNIPDSPVQSGSPSKNKPNFQADKNYALSRSQQTNFLSRTSLSREEPTTSNSNMQTEQDLNTKLKTSFVQKIKESQHKRELEEPEDDCEEFHSPRFNKYPSISPESEDYKEKFNRLLPEYLSVAKQLSDKVGVHSVVEQEELQSLQKSLSSLALGGKFYESLYRLGCINLKSITKLADACVAQGGQKEANSHAIRMQRVGISGSRSQVDEARHQRQETSVNRRVDFAAEHSVPSTGEQGAYVTSSPESMSPPNVVSMNPTLRYRSGFVLAPMVRQNSGVMGGYEELTDRTIENSLAEQSLPGPKEKREGSIYSPLSFKQSPDDVFFGGLNHPPSEPETQRGDITDRENDILQARNQKTELDQKKFAKINLPTSVTPSQQPKQSIASTKPTRLSSAKQPFVKPSAAYYISPGVGMVYSKNSSPTHGVQLSNSNSRLAADYSNLAFGNSKMGGKTQGHHSSNTSSVAANRQCPSAKRATDIRDTARLPIPPTQRTEWMNSFTRRNNVLGSSFGSNNNKTGGNQQLNQGESTAKVASREVSHGDKSQGKRSYLGLPTPPRNRGATSSHYPLNQTTFQIGPKNQELAEGKPAIITTSTSAAALQHKLRSELNRSPEIAKTALTKISKKRREREQKSQERKESYTGIRKMVDDIKSDLKAREHSLDQTLREHFQRDSSKGNASTGRRPESAAGTTNQTDVFALKRRMNVATLVTPGLVGRLASRKSSSLATEH